MSNEVLEEIDEYIVIDSEPSNDGVSALTQRVFGDITKQSAARQVVIGGATGACPA